MDLSNRSNRSGNREPGEWTKEGCVLAYERGLKEGQGLHPPPHVLPYKPLGTHPYTSRFMDGTVSHSTTVTSSVTDFVFLLRIH